MILRNLHLLAALSAAFLLPNILFAGHLAFVPAAIVMVGCVLCIALVLRRRPLTDGTLLAEPIDRSTLFLCLAVSVVMILLGGEGHVFFTNWDWLWRDAVLADLVRSPALPIYDVDGQTYLLRAPLGLYLVPALVGHLTSLGIGHAALFAQDVLVTAALLYFVKVLSAKRGFMVLVVFAAFSGLDILGTLLMAVGEGRDVMRLTLPSHLEHWSPVFQYSSHITQLFWVPNHALPGWWLAILALLCARRDISLGELGLACAVCLIWSPLAVAGALPIAAFLMAGRLGEIRDRQLWLAVPPALCFVPVALYLMGDSASVPHELLLFVPGFWPTVLPFLLLEIPQAIIVAAAWERLPPPVRKVVVPALALLLVLPVYQIGSNDDLLMRGSIPALALLAFAFGQVLADGWRPRAVVFGAALTIALIGAVTPAFEIARSLVMPRFAISDCNLVSAWQSLAPSQWLANYLARPSAMPGWLLDAPAVSPLSRETKICWPDHPFDPTLSVAAKSNAELLRAGRQTADLPNKTTAR